MAWRGGYWSQGVIRGHVNLVEWVGVWGGGLEELRRTSGLLPPVTRQMGVPWARKGRMGKRVWGGSGGVSSSRLNWEEGKGLEGKGLDYFV